MVGRNKVELSRLWPNLQVCSYEELAERGRGFDQLLHLAVLNNDANASDQEYFLVNVDFALRTARSAREAGIGHFINVSSFHAIGDALHPYARSKRAAVEALQAEQGITCTSIYLPAVYGDRWSGKLAVLNRLPGPLARALFTCLSAIKPTVHVRAIADACDISSCSGVRFVADDQDRNVVYSVVRRMIDVSFAMVVVLMFWWALLLIWCAVRLQSPGPGIFAQTRVGKRGQHFTCYKFRTMYVGTLQAGTHQVSTTAVTPLGNFMRRTKIDELPQVWNILQNELSLVGPRPCLPVQVELVAAREARNVFAVSPGITGLAQVNDVDMSEPVRLAEWDARYVATRSLLLDLAILVRTALGRGQGDRISSRKP